MLVKQIINLDLQLIAAKTKQFPTHLLTPHRFAPHPSELQPPTPQPIQLNDITRILTERPRQIPSIYWQLGQPIGAPVSNFRQIKYLPLINALPDLDQALAGTRLDCGRDLHKQLSEFGGSEKVWMTVQVEYKPVNPLANKQPCEQYLRAAPTRMFMRDGTISSFAKPYIDCLQIQTDRIREFNAKLIRDQSGLPLARVLQFTLIMVKYAFLETRGWQFLQEFLSNKKAILNIKNNDERCFVYALRYFLESEGLPKRQCYQESLYKEQMFHRNHLATRFYPNSPKNVHLYEDQLQMNINVFSIFDDEGRARYPLVISRTNHVRVANLLDWKQHYAPITSIQRLFKDITKHKQQLHFCLRCLGYF